MSKQSEITRTRDKGEVFSNIVEAISGRRFDNAIVLAGVFCS